MAHTRTSASNVGDVSVRGATAPSGVKWIKVRQRRNKIWIARSTFMTDPREVKHRLALADIIILGSAAWSNLMSEVAAVTEFPPRQLLEQPGWTGTCFALPSGQIFAPPRTRPICLFEPNQQKCARAGTLDGWRREVAEPVAEQMLAVFMLMTPYVAPLLRLTNRTGNFGFELIGPPGTGKTTLLHLMASTVGAAANGFGPRYWSTCNTTVNALELKAEEHSDLPLLLDDATMFVGSDGGGARGRAFKSFVFSLAQGETKHRLNGARPRSFRLVFALTSNQPLSDVIRDVEEREAGATADRLLTLDVGLREHGIFDHIPWRYADATEFARVLVDGMSAQYGTAMPAFLAQLVEHRCSDESRLRTGIRERTDRFIQRVQVDRDNGSAVRVAEAFGLVSAAGNLAQHYGVLPTSFDCEAAAEAAYRLHQASCARESCIDRLLKYLSDPAVIDMESQGLAHVSDEQFMTAPALYRCNRDGVGEYLIVPATLQRAFPDYDRLLKDPQVERVLQREGRHRTVKRPLRRGRGDDRVHCIRSARPDSRRRTHGKM